MVHHEIFGLLDGELVYALESTASVIDGELTAPWNATYLIEGPEAVHHESLGHGETELPGWEPESIVAQWEGRSARFLELRTTD